ncbi:MAG: peptidyl-prolyl cis-trans isomerase [Gemmatimonadota bacterium]
MTRRAPFPLLVVSLALATACSPPDAGRPDFVAAAYLRLVAAEDARPAGGDDLELLLRGTRSPAPALRAVAARALGRLEDPRHVEAIASLLSDPDPSVRREAANAVAQAVHRGDGAPALPLLLAATSHEADPAVLGVLARSLGRLRVEGPDRAAVARALVALSRPAGGDASRFQMEGVVLGMAAFVGRLRGEAPPEALRRRLAELAAYGLDAPAGDVSAMRVRGVAVATHAALGLEAGEAEALLRDPAAEVRRAVAARLAALPEAERPRVAASALSDPSPQVRLEAVRRGLAPPPLSGEACLLLLATAGADADAHVRHAALDALATPCPDRGGQSSRLAEWAGPLAEGASEWHAPAHALAALAAVDPARASGPARTSAGHPVAFARTWVAMAAGRAGDATLLRELAGDASPNVRTEALRGLASVAGRGADPELLQALRDADDNQLLLAVAGLLAGTDARADAADAALGALERISQPRWETLRDARMALLDLVDATGDTTLVPRVEPYLRDYDPAMAKRAADLLLGWTGKRWIDAPRGSPRLAVPTLEELGAMERGSVVLHMARGGAIHVRLMPWQAPTNAARFWRLAREGALDGLTFHRVAANFVVQGGSPGANEYAGHGAYTRDEVGLVPNWRGTVGLSTRGRDTGDGQIYVNLVDNVRLDHDYTIFGVVMAGMDVVDAVLEGDVIRRVEVFD